MASSALKPPPTGTGSAIAPEPSRSRLQIDLSEPVALLLDHVSAVFGVPKSQLVLQALVHGLPSLIEQADQLRKRSRELAQASGKPPGR